MQLKGLTFFILALMALSCGTKKENHSTLNFNDSDSVVFSSNLEKSSNFIETSNSDFKLDGAKFITSEIARSGEKSIHLDSSNLYGLNFSLDHLQGGEFIELSIWQKMGGIDGAIEVNLKSESHITHYRSYYNPLILGEDGWQKHYLSFVVAESVTSFVAHVFSGGQSVYFDDFEVKIFKHLPQNELALNLNLELPKASKDQMAANIDKAKHAEVIPDAAKKYVNGSLIHDLDSAAIKMKIKGDWKDHLYSGKESYRIKIEGEMGINGMKNFSIQHPKTRNYLNEWVIHRMADKESVLTTRYDFANVTINSINHGVYAVEEHFDKQLLESRNRREGPILKFDESSYWAAISSSESFEAIKELPYFQESPIDVFKGNRTAKSKQLSKQFTDGQNLLQLFKDVDLNISELFDIDQLAKFYALMELSGSEHGLRWHNRRFYFNPVTQKLEHIAYDISPFHYYPNVELHFLIVLNAPKRFREFCFDNAILYNKDFKARFLFHLNRMSQVDYLNAFFKEIEADLEVNKAALEGEMRNYTFDRSIFYKHAKFIQANLSTIDSLWDEKIMTHPDVDDWVEGQAYNKRTDDGVIKAFTINGYQNFSNGKYEVLLENFHSNSVCVHAYTVKDQEGVYYLDSAIQINGFKTKAAVGEFTSVLKLKKVYFTIENNPKLILSAKISDWPKPKGGSTRMNLEKRFKLLSPYYVIKGNQLVFRKNIEVDELLFIPSKYEVVIQPGSRIKLEGEGGIIITNNFTAIGSANNPILIYSESGVSNGITVLKGGRAVLKQVEFKGLSNLDFGNWELTGAINFYETDVLIEDCVISGNSSEDALNIIRSHFTIKNLSISDTYSDGFDADFCTGIISHSNFSNTGNDCIDFSGSIVSIENINIKDSGDKGISGGEGSKLTLKNIQIKGAITGIASKDATEIRGTQINIKHVEYACAAFRKKPEYDFASIQLTEVNIKNAIQRLLIDKGSSITLNGETEMGVENLDIDSLYARFNEVSFK